MHVSHVETTAANVRECFMLRALDRNKKTACLIHTSDFYTKHMIDFQEITVIHGKWIVSLVAQECFLFLLLQLEFCTCFTYISYFK